MYLVETIRNELETIENEKGQNKYSMKNSNQYLIKNPEYNILKLYNGSINGNDVDLKEDPAI